MDYIKDARVGKHLVEQPPLMPVELFGNTYRVYNDEWRNHLHIICTYQCNAKCEFCVEKDSECKTSVKFLKQVEVVLAEMHSQGILNTVSITGGEPTIFKDLIKLVDLIKKYDVFLTINTNGARLHKLASDLKDKVDFINISRHYVDDRKNIEIFKAKVPTLIDIKNLRSLYGDTKFRFQAVINEDTNLKEYAVLVEQGLIDDLSFRQLMLDGSEEALNNRKLYLDLVQEAVDNGAIIEQEVQDYYVYETHDLYGCDMTFSYSDMKLLEDQEKIEGQDFIREFIIYPDGKFSGSWFNEKNILE